MVASTKLAHGIKAASIKEVLIAVMVTIVAVSLVRTLMNLLNRDTNTSSQSQHLHQPYSTQPALDKGYFGFYDSRYNQTQQMFDMDIRQVKTATEQRTHEDIAFFEETDVNVVPVFHNIVPEIPIWRLYLISHNPFILTSIWLLKLFYNRARPYQMEEINTLQSVSGHTPSYPSGHAVQAYALAKQLKRLCPEKAQELDTMADRVAYIRHAGGYHFPTDTEYSRYLVAQSPFF